MALNIWSDQNHKWVEFLSQGCLPPHTFFFFFFDVSSVIWWSVSGLQIVLFPLRSAVCVNSHKNTLKQHWACLIWHTIVMKGTGRGTCVKANHTSESSPPVMSNYCPTEGASIQYNQQGSPLMVHSLVFLLLNRAETCVKCLYGHFIPFGDNYS